MAPIVDTGKTEPSTPVSDAEAAEMRCIDASATPVITQIKVSLRYSGELLAKDDGKWTPWSRYMKLELTMCGLYEYIFDPPDIPNKMFEPRAHRNWQLNNCLARSFLMLGLCESERNLADDSVDAKVLWAYLQTRHGGAGPVQQVRLLQEALTMKCSPGEPITKTIDRIFEKIDRAFDVGTVTKELLKSVAALSSLSENSLYAGARSIILRDLAAAMETSPYGPEEIRRFLENEQTLYAADKAGMDTLPTALATTKPPNRRDELVCEGCRSRGRPVYTGHTKPWCILDGGGMAGKTLDEARTARLAYFKTRRDNWEKKKGTSKLTITPAGGSAFTVEGDSDVLATYIASQSEEAKTEFAGLAADLIPGMEGLMRAEELEVDAWLALEEEMMTGLDWKDYMRDASETTLSSTTTAFDVCPFYLDSGTTVHISPNPSDFVALHNIPHKSI